MSIPMEPGLVGTSEKIPKWDKKAEELTQWCYALDRRGGSLVQPLLNFKNDRVVPLLNFKSITSR